MHTQWESLANTHILGIAPYEPGKPIEELERELGIHDAIKLASNENPMPPSERVQKAIAAALADLNRYPDGSGFYLRQALAKNSCAPSCARATRRWCRTPPSSSTR
jgi:histidinol-phosphate aminotransferase